MYDRPRRHTGRSGLTVRGRVGSARTSVVAGALALMLGGWLAACDGDPVETAQKLPRAAPEKPTGRVQTEESEAATGVVELAFAGDVHFELHLAKLLDRPRGALGPITATLRDADLTMVNLETAITRRGAPLHETYHFRTPAASLDVLRAAGVDVVSLANNHAVDYGPVGLRDTLRAVRNSPVAVVGSGTDRQAAFEPYLTTAGSTDIAVFGASSEPDQLARSAAGPDEPGIAAAPRPRPRVLLDAVSDASRAADVVVVYLHWGLEYQPCPTRKQRVSARALSEAGADVIVGSHAHVQLGSGWLDDAYVNYGLGNFVWYHNNEPESGVLEIRVKDGEVVEDTWNPALIQTYGLPRPLSGSQQAAAVDEWQQLRTCTRLSPTPRG